MSRSLADSWEVLPTGTFALDGGAMFGIIPRLLWEAVLPPDSAHRVHLALNCLLVRSGDRVILVETGIGTALDDRFRERHAPSSEDGLARALAAAGVGPGEVTDVVNTHLHWDHAGGNTCRDRTGDLTPAFPHATYYVHRAELALARAAPYRMSGSYCRDHFEPLVAAGNMVLLDGATRIAPGVMVHPAPGHLPHMQVVTVETDQGMLFAPADLIPTHHHLAQAWGMAYDCEPLTVAREKARWLERAVGEDWTILFYHDHQVPTGRVEMVDNRCRLRAGGGD
jgi:glyoxylase-like metal-dependent hydrolase (beta-lactamase superfamily II)